MLSGKLIIAALTNTKQLKVVALTTINPCIAWPVRRHSCESRTHAGLHPCVPFFLGSHYLLVNHIFIREAGARLCQRKFCANQVPVSVTYLSLPLE